MAPTFADTVKKKIIPLTSFSHPTEEQGIIFNHVEGAKIREYLMAVHKLVGGAQNIVAASRVSGERVIFLASKEITDQFQNTSGGFLMGDLFIKTRKLKTPAIKVIISNVSPTILNTVLENQLTNTFGLKLVSPISILRVSPTDDIFSHIISWRRQVYIYANSDRSSIPTSFQLNHAVRTYRIFLTTDDLVCFKCGSKGHKADDCTKIIDEEVPDHFNNEENDNSVISVSPSPFPPLNIPSVDSTQINAVPPNITSTNKRGASQLSSTTHSETSDQVTDDFLSISSDTSLKPAKDDIKRKRRHKKLKTNTDTFLKALKLTSEEKSVITDTVNLIKETKYTDCDFTAEDIINFLPTIRGSNQKVSLAKALTQNLSHLQCILEEIKPKLESGTKKTITSLVKSIENYSHLSDFSDNSV